MADVGQVNENCMELSEVNVSCYEALEEQTDELEKTVG